VAKGHEKWVMQLLIDFKFVKQAGGMHVDFTTGAVTFPAAGGGPGAPEGLRGP